MVRNFHPTNIALRYAFNGLVFIRVRASSRVFLDWDPGLIDELYLTLLRKVDRWWRRGILNNRVQCRCIYLHAELVAWRIAHTYFFATRVAFWLLLGAECALRLLPKMRVDRARIGSVEE